MKERFQNLKNGKAATFLKAFLNWRYLPFITAAVDLLCYYLGLDIVIIYYVGLTVSLSLFLLDDITPIIGILLFTNCMVTKINSPSPLAGGADYYSNPVVLVFIAIIAVILVCSVIYRIVYCFKNKTFKITPMFWGYVALSVSFLCAGFFSQDYNPMNMVYGLLMTVFHAGFFILISGNTKVSQENYLRIAFSFLALSLMLLIELSVLYATTPGIISDLSIDKEKISFGWGMWNTIGMLFTVSLPFILYIASKYKHGWIFTLYSIIVVFGVLLSGSRQSMLATAVIYIISYIVLLVKGKNRKINFAIAAVSVIAVVAVILIFSEQFVEFLKNMLSSLVNSEGEFTGNGRTGLIELAIEAFKANPIFGGGWYIELAEDPGFAGISLVPDMYHNSIFQMLGACGIIGLISYLVHRVQTIVAYFRQPTTDRTFIAIAVLALLIMGLFDNHIFYIFPTMFYSAFIAVIENGSKPEKPITSLKK